MDSKKPAAQEEPRNKTLEESDLTKISDMYDPAIARKICEMLSEGVPLREICRMPGFPKWRTFYDWLARDETLDVHFARARAMGYDALAEECLDIADNANNDWMERFDEKGRSAGWTLNGEHVQRSKLRIETRLKLLAKWSKKYGDEMTLKGDPNAPLQHKHDATSEFSELIEAIKMRRQAERDEKQG